MLIGLGGGAASSVASGASQEDLDFASVQRDNAEMQRRCQEVIDRCWALGDGQPHRLHPRRRRGRPVERPARAGARQPPGRPLRAARRSPATSRHVAAGDLVQRGAGALRAGHRRRGAGPRSRRCAGASGAPFAVLGQATRRRAPGGRRPRCFGNRPIDMPLEVLLGKPPRMMRDVRRRAARRGPPFDYGGDRPGRGDRARAAAAGGGRQDVPHHHRRPHGDRAGGARPDGGPAGRCRWPTPPSPPPATTATTGEAMAMGERTPLALLDAAAAAAHGGGRGDHQHRLRARSPSWAT